MTHSKRDGQSSTHDEPGQEPPTGTGSAPLRQPRRKWAVVGATAVFAAAAFGGWAWTVGPLSGERYCWGAWQEGAGSPILGDEALKDDGSRSATGPAPTADRPIGKCTLAVKSVSNGISYQDRVTVRYGAAPQDPAERRAWIGEYLYAGGERLPDGLPGIVDTDRGLVVLPKECDQGGQPTVVTLRAHGTSSSDGDSVANPANLGTERDVASLLLEIANTGMEKAGCSAGKKLQLTSAYPAPEAETEASQRAEAGPVPTGVCDIPGWRSGDNWVQTGRDEHLEICTVLAETPQEEPQLAGQFLTTSDPRLIELFNSMVGDRSPGSGWQGKGVVEDTYAVVKAECHGAPTIYFQQLNGDLQKTVRPGPQQAFANAVNAATERAQCDGVAPAN